ncbi:hypothetical protein [Plantactinospora sp. CA-290183]|uniref:hypothetical protein n=1 Tax=Plantactinospora sp. CA-290183 TaxID=3240006 RepID=UPI003D8C2538
MQSTVPERAWKVAVPLLRDAKGARLYLTPRRPEWHCAVLFCGLDPVVRVILARAGWERTGWAPVAGSVGAALVGYAGGILLTRAGRDPRVQRMLTGLVVGLGFLLAAVLGATLLPASVAVLAAVLLLSCFGELGYRAGRPGSEPPAGAPPVGSGATPPRRDTAPGPAPALPAWPPPARTVADRPRLPRQGRRPVRLPGPEGER